ncbi:hypothetical protein [Chitinophaga sp. HK235]|uniref:hypothetical protein n=1 Tax=Chitinophaga sp. HK235 TaxID=2952571 RepID=UPI001BAAE714|nr:hypothetical protein [Chitinophaga sp. HK235]
MIKRILLLGLAVNLLWACNSGKGTENATNDSVYTSKDSTQSEHPISAHPDIIDTLKVGDKQFLVYFIDKATFEQYPEYDYSVDSSSESRALAKDSTVKRVGDDLIFRLANGQQKIRTNIESDGEDFAHYQYAGYYPALHRHGLDITFYEAMGFELLNPDNGDTLRVWAPPVISPDKKYFLCPSMDLEAGFLENGFQLFEVKNKNIVPIGDIGLEQYGISKVQWIDNKTLIATYQTHEDIVNQRTRYVKMVMQ